jgi:type I restriction enzyme M protein
LFAKGGQTDNVFFFDVQADGRTLDDKRDKIGAEDDWQDLDVLRRLWPKWNGGAGKKHFTVRTANAFFVPKSEIVANGFDLSINRYKEIVHEEEQYDPPKVIIERLKQLEAEIKADLAELEGMLG